MTSRVFIFMFAFLIGAAAVAEPLADDGREAAPRTLVERTYILAQMRLFLASLQEINEGLANGQTSMVAEAAAARGMRRNANDPDHPASMSDKETQLWKQMGGATRRGFDQLAAAAEQGESKEKLLGILGETMKNCVACHQTYRLAEAPK
jgi:cytochrome c556